MNKKTQKSQISKSIKNEIKFQFKMVNLIIKFHQKSKVNFIYQNQTLNRSQFKLKRIYPTNSFLKMKENGQNLCDILKLSKFSVSFWKMK